MKKSVFIIALLLLIWSSDEHFASAQTIDENRKLRPGEARIWYLDRAGFAVQTSQRFLLFDYYNPTPAQGNGSGFAAGVVDLSALQGQPVWGFISHEHTDHFNKNIVAELNQRLGKNIHWVTTREVAAELSKEPSSGNNLTVIGAGEQRKVNDIQVRTLLSTDAGVAFLVTVDGLTIYHAGDHAWWDKELEQPFKTEIGKLKGVKIDLAFITVDPRVRTLDFAGALYIARTLQPKVVIPMHRLGKTKGSEPITFEEGHAFVEAVKQLALSVMPATINRRGAMFLLQAGQLKPASGRGLSAQNRLPER